MASAQLNLNIHCWLRTSDAKFLRNAGTKTVNHGLWISYDCDSIFYTDLFVGLKQLVACNFMNGHIFQELKEGDEI